MFLDRRDYEPNSMWRAVDSLFGVTASLARSDEDYAIYNTRKAF